MTDYVYRGERPKWSGTEERHRQHFIGKPVASTHGQTSEDRVCDCVALRCVGYMVPIDAEGMVVKCIECGLKVRNPAKKREN